MKTPNSFVISISIFIFISIGFGIASPLNEDESIAADEDNQQQQQYCVSDIEQDPKILREQCLDAKDWALSNGLIKFIQQKCERCQKKTKKAAKKINVATQFLPLSLYPSPFPRKLFQQAKDVHKAMLLLYFRASINFEFLKEANSELINSDSANTTKKVIAKLEQYLSEGIRQPVGIFCQRADYMASEDDNGQYVLKQVEVNTGAIGSFATTPRFSQLHQRMVANAGIDASDAMMPPDQSDLMIAETLLYSWKQFGNNEAVILFVHGHRYGHLLLESRQIQHKLEQITTEKVQCKFINLNEGFKRLKLDSVNFNLVLDNEFVVAIMFDRVGETVSAEESALIYEIDRSTAIKVPPFEIAFTHRKRMQQVFTKPGMVERFFQGPGEEQMAEAIRKVQTKGWPIGANDAGAEEIKRKAIANPEKYVLKANECGPSTFPNIFFNEDISKKLARMTPAEHDYFDIMERLRPMVIKNHFVRPNSEPIFNLDATPELGIFGCLVGNMLTGQVSFFSRTGHMMKTKMAHVNEGGVWRGASVYDSPYLV
ncbi:hypothetical protein niasHT_029736 [Heterodera trifolii]|uniref:Glutathione synthetase n=1 Tax=Heterodera trifolii TaxID=157864 RepID=A0ABD2KQN9_9BILA